MANSFRENKISVKDLNLWSENPRFPQSYLGKPESELIDYITSVPHYKIKAFGKEVAQDFDMPVFEKFAVYDGEGEYVAFEGNRRLTVYKLLINPDLSSDKDLRLYFHQLKRSINIDDSFKIDCVISNDKLEVLRYVNRKHLNNNNEIAWGTIENSNAKLRWLENPEKVDIFKSNISILIRNLEIPQEEKEKILGKGFVTTLFRILNTRTSARFFELVFDDDNNLISGKDNFISSLQIIIKDILEKKEFKGKKFSRLNSVDVEDYLKSIVVYEQKIETSKNLHPKKDVEEHKKTEDKRNDIATVKNKNKQEPSEIIGTSGAKTPPKKAQPDRKTTQRKYLIPKDCHLEIQEPKINNIYCELKKDLLIDDSSKAVPNAVGILFRVFLEISLDYYAEKKQGNPFKKDHTISNKISWVVEKLKTQGHANNFKNISVVGSGKMEHSYLSIEKFHQYVHSTTLEPSSSELKSKWDMLQPFFELIWNSPKK